MKYQSPETSVTRQKQTIMSTERKMGETATLKEDPVVEKGKGKTFEEGQEDRSDDEEDLDVLTLYVLSYLWMQLY